MKTASILLKKKLDKDIDHFLSNSQIHYLKKVLKVRKDESFHVYDGSGSRASCIFTDHDKITLLETSYFNQHYNCSALVPFLKKNHFEFCLQKLVEIGVSKIFLYISEKTKHKFSAAKESTRSKRYEEIVEAAFLQSENFYLPEIDILEDIYAMDFNNFQSICVLHQMAEVKMNNKETYDLIVSGGEFGFSDNEEKFLKQTTATFSNLGKNILRAETAPVVALAINNMNL